MPHAIRIGRDGRSRGFTLVELMVVMGLTVFVMTAASQIMIAMVGQFKQQTIISESSTEALVGLEIMKTDLKGIGYGLAWVIANSLDYEEPHIPSIIATAHDNAPDAPRPFVLLENISAALATNIKGIEDSDYLIVKSLIAASSETAAGPYTSAGKWHSLTVDGDGVIHANTWGSSSDLLMDDYVVIVSLATEIELAIDLKSTSDFTVQWNLINGAVGEKVTDLVAQTIPNVWPLIRSDIRLVYGISDDVVPDMPYNRADYYISTEGVPGRCAEGTGVLVKRVYLHETGALGAALPLLDCVADMQVVVALDRDTDGDFVVGSGSPADTYDDGTLYTAYDAEDIREQLSEVRVYILTHDGRYDPNYVYEDPDNGNSTITLALDTGYSKDYDVSTLARGEHYRWRVHTLVETPTTLRAR